MAQLAKCTDAYGASRTIKIVAAETTDYTVYVIEVSVGRYSWWVKHRYSEFLEMHDRLVFSCKLDKEIFPPKKLFGKTSDAFIAKRQAQLEIYLQTVLLHLYSTNQPLPQVLTNFLDFPKYEIHGITEMLAECLYTRGDWYLHSNEMFTVQTLQLHAVHERLKLAEPTCESGDKKRDLGHVLDFITRVKNLKIVGSRDPVCHSNIDMNQLHFDLTIFRNLETLRIVNVNVAMVAGVEVIKRTTKKLYVRHSVNSLEEILLRDIVELSVHSQSYLVPAWSVLKMADFSHNDIAWIDESVKLMPKVESLSLSHNQLMEIQHLASLCNLRNLDLSHNKLRFLDTLHTKLGNLKTLNLSGNQISSLQGLSKLYSLEVLDLQSNEIAFVLEIHHIATLPCLEQLILTGNPITVIVDYRTKMFELFAERAGELYLDNKKATQKERDTVAILQAIQKAREGRERAKRHIKKPATEVAIVEPSSLLDSYHDISSAPSLPDPGDTTGRDPFRRRVETIRAQVGESWLSLLNEMHQSTARETVYPDSVTAASSRPPTDIDVTDDGSYSVVTAGIPSQLPGISDAQFTFHLHQYLTSLNLSSHIPGITGSPHDKPERIVYVIWCVCIPYTTTTAPYSACCLLTDEMLHILRYDGPAVTVAPPGACSAAPAPPTAPRLNHMYSICVRNLQEIVVGYKQLYFRVEESFTGSQGTFALVTSNPTKTLQFVSYLKDMSSINGDDVLMVQDYNDVSESQLLELLSKQENRRVTDVVYYNIVQVPGSSTLVQVPGSSTLVQVPGSSTLCHHGMYAACLTSDYLHLLEVNPVHFPSTTFNLVNEGHHYKILHSQTLHDSINSVQFCNASAKHAESDTAGHSTHGLTLKFENEADLCHFRCVFQSAELRDLFLCQLMRLRRDLSLRVTDTGGGHIDGQADSTAAAKMSKLSVDACEIGEDCCVDMGNQRTNQEPASCPREMTVAEYSKLENWHKPLTQRTNAQQCSNPCAYPSLDFLHDLSEINRNIDFLIPVSSAMQALAYLTGEELFNYFHEKVAQIGVEAEELRHVVWTNVSPYTFSDLEIMSCVMLSTRTIYFISDRQLPSRSPRYDVTKTHRRNQSDSLLKDTKFRHSLHHRSGVLHMPSPETAVARCYGQLDLAELCQVNVGLSETSFRLTSDNPETTFTCLTRNESLTNAFLRHLTSIMASFSKATSPDLSSSDSEQDFYKAYSAKETDQKSRKVLHAKDDLFDLKYLIGERLLMASETVDIIQYLPVYVIKSLDTVEKFENLRARTLILCSFHIGFLDEDYVHYPVPDFARYPPSRPRHELCDLRRLDFLKRVTVSDFTSNDIMLVFADHIEDVEVDPSYDHYSADSSKESVHPGEVKWSILIQCVADKDRVLTVLSERWKLCHDGRELSIQVNA